MPLDILALAAHRDDVEQTCGGTLLKMAERGYRTGILDLTQGEMGTRGTIDDRAHEAAEAARILKVSWRHALDIPDGRVENTWENRLKVARVLREQRPRVLILPYWEGRHPDHYTASILGYEAAFLSGLPRSAISSQLSAPSEPSATAAPHRPFKIIYASLYRDVRPTFVVDITAQFETRFAALMAYKSQFTDQEAGSGIFPAQKEIRARVESMARYLRHARRRHLCRAVRAEGSRAGGGCDGDSGEVDLRRTAVQQVAPRKAREVAHLVISITVKETNPRYTSPLKWPTMESLCEDFGSLDLTLIFISASFVLGQEAKKPITNADVVKLTQASLPESTIILAIEQGQANFDTSPAALIELKKQGVSQAVMEVMLRTSSEPDAAKPATDTPVPNSASLQGASKSGAETDILADGTYYKSPGGW